MIQDIKDYIDNDLSSYSVYVGTYKKYNEGNLYGAWIDLTKVYSEDEFYEICLLLHNDEEDPEIMFQDFNDIPESLQSESQINFEYLLEWLELDEDDKDKCREYWEYIDEDTDVQSILERYVCEIDDFEEHCENLFYEFYPGIPDSVIRYIDFESYASDIKSEYYESYSYIFDPNR